MLSKLRNSKGFTLIEVVIVLAIAGLIFVIVFLAVSQAQASRRDTQRKSDADRFIAGVNQYASNNNGDVPSDQTATNTFLSTYMTNFKSPNGTTYTATYATTGTPADGALIYSASAKCSGNAMTTGTARQFAVLYFQERGGTVCKDNQ